MEMDLEREVKLIHVHLVGAVVNDERKQPFLVVAAL
jgi:hypothetical protein